MASRKTSVEIDFELAEATKKALNTRTLRETIENAFLEVLRAEARRQEIEALSTMRGLELDDPEVMSGAWSS